jgi:hypothetical protein
LEAFKRRDLYEVGLVALFLDAIFLNVRPKGPKEGVLCAWGFTQEGERVLVGVCLGMRESHEDWLELGRDLIARRLPAPMMVVADGAPGLIKAVEQCWPASDRQHCSVHRARNLIAKLPEQERERVRRAYWQTLDEAKHERDARERLEALVSELERAGYASAARCLADDLDALVVHLRYRGLAEWWPLRRLERHEISGWLGSMSFELLIALEEISEGTVGVLVELWDDWRRRGLIEQDDAGRWGVVGGIDRTLVDAADTLTDTLKSLLGTDDAHQLEDVRQLLACAALEGRTFTADAVAQALGRDRDEVIDFLDERLAVDVSGSELLEEADGVRIVPVRGEVRHLWRYRFVRSLDWRIARERFSTTTEKCACARQLAAALSRLYAPQEDRIATTLAALYTRVGDTETAARYRRIVKFGVSPAVLRAPKLASSCACAPSIGRPGNYAVPQSFSLRRVRPCSGSIPSSTPSGSPNAPKN